MQGPKNLALLIGFFSILAHAATLSVSRNARTFDFINSSLVVKGLAHSCLAMFEISDSIPCNPAMVPYASKQGLKVQGLLSNGYSSLEKAQKLLSGNIDTNFLNALFGGGNVLQIEETADAYFTSKVINLEWSPDSIKMFGVIRNEANPMVDLYATEEKTFTLQGGLKLGKDFSAGVRGRFVDRKVVKNSILLVSLATQSGQAALQPKAQTAIYVEPGLNYTLEHKWKTRLSIIGANIGYVSQPLDEVPVSPELQIGAGVSPPMPYGELDLLVDYKQLTYDEDPWNRFHFGAAYKIGAMTALTGIDINGISGGFQFGVEKATAGILFSTTQFPSNNSNTYAQTVYVELEWQL